MRHPKSIILRITCIYIMFIAVSARQVLELQSANFELALSSYKYVAVLFYDKSTRGQHLLDAWMAASEDLDALSSDAELAKVNGNDPDVLEIIEGYGIRLPSINVFRRGIMTEYRGPYDARGMIPFILDDSQPSVTFLHSIVDLKESLSSQLKTTVIGFFNTDDIVEDEGSETFSVTSWGQYQASADTLRGHATFYATTAADLINSFEISSSKLPIVYMLSEDTSNLIQYTGELLEMKISDWVLTNSPPVMGELSITSSAGELFTAQFFSSTKMKFIFLLQAVDIAMMTSTSSDDDHDDISVSSMTMDDIEMLINSLSIIQAWQLFSSYFKSKALFAYMIADSPNSVADVIGFFHINPHYDLPMIVAHDPILDAKYKSSPLTSSASDIIMKQYMKDFVVGVLSDVVPKVIKSEPKPKNSIKNHVLQVVGSNVIDIVSQVDKDVMLELYAPWCAHCKRMRSTYDILGRAVAAESRIVVAKMDGTANDIPSSWNIKGYPTILWFPAKDKPYITSSQPMPRSYWDAGYSLHELIAFMQREGSFDMKTLKVATLEQQGQMLSEEDVLRAKYEIEDKAQKRNEGRDVYDNSIIDYLFGEIVIDGTRFHVALVSLITITAIISILLFLTKSNPTAKKPSLSSMNSSPSTNHHIE